MKHLNKINIIIGYSAISTLITQQQIKQSRVDIIKNAKNYRLKAEIGLFIKKCNRPPN